MVQARIFQPARRATQSGRARTKRWILIFEQSSTRRVEPLMGWTASRDMNQEVRLNFNSKEEAVAFARKNDLSYVVHEPHKRRVLPKSYSDNFRYDRVVAHSFGSAEPDVESG